MSYDGISILGHKDGILRLLFSPIALDRYKENRTFIQMTTFNRPFRSLEAINGQFADKRSGSVRTTVWASTRCIGTTHCRGNTWEKYRQSKARNGKGTLCYLKEEM